MRRYKIKYYIKKRLIFVDHSFSYTYFKKEKKVYLIKNENFTENNYT